MCDTRTTVLCLEQLLMFVSKLPSLHALVVWDVYNGNINWGTELAALEAVEAGFSDSQLPIVVLNDLHNLMVAVTETNLPVDLDSTNTLRMEVIRIVKEVNDDTDNESV